MLDALDFQLHGQGDNRIAVWDWTGLRGLNSAAGKMRPVKFGGQLFSGTPYYDPENIGDVLAAQKAGPIPLGDECGAAGLSTGTPPPATCPENGLATNGDNMTQASQAQGQLWGAISTQVNQTFTSDSSELHQGAVYWVVNTDSFDRTGQFTHHQPGVRLGCPRRPGIPGDGRRRLPAATAGRSWSSR